MDFMRKKKILSCLLGFAIFVIIIFVADILLKDVTHHGVKQGLGLYDQPENTIDVLMVGSSHVHYGINTALLWEDYGLASYDYSSAEQTLWASYHYIVEACKSQKPKVVVLDFFTPAAFQEDHKFKYHYLSDTLYGMKFSRNKLELMRASFDGDIELWDRFFPGFFGYHDRYNFFETEHIENIFQDYSDFKGYTPHFGKCPSVLHDLNTDEIKPISDKSLEYLDRIIDYTSENGMELYITIVPYCVNSEQTEGKIQEEDKRYNWLEQYMSEVEAKGNDHVHFDYTLKHLESFDLHMGDGEDMDDPTHLNYYGSCKFTSYLGEDLRRLYGTELLPDHRGDPLYESWDGNVKIIKTEVESHGFEWR